MARRPQGAVVEPGARHARAADVHAVARPEILDCPALALAHKARVPCRQARMGEAARQAAWLTAAGAGRSAAEQDLVAVVEAVARRAGERAIALECHDQVRRGTQRL